MATPLDDNLANIYTLFFRHSTNHLQNKNFRFQGNLKDARARAQIHCDIMGYKLNFVQPLISNLQVEEDHHYGRGTSAPPIPASNPREKQV